MDHQDGNPSARINIPSSAYSVNPGDYIFLYRDGLAFVGNVTETDSQRGIAINGIAVSESEGFPFRQSSYGAIPLLNEWIIQGEKEWGSAHVARDLPSLIAQLRQDKPGLASFIELSFSNL